MQQNVFACVSNARPFVALSTAKIYFRYKHNYSTKVTSGYPIIILENENSSFQIVKQWSWGRNTNKKKTNKLKIIRFCSKGKIFLLFNRDTSAVHHANSVRTLRHHVCQISHEITSMCWCRLTQHMHKLKYTFGTIYHILISPFCFKTAQEIMFLWRLNPINDPCWRMSRKYLTLFLHCVFVSLELVSSLFGFSILNTSGFTGFSTHTQSNFAICSLQFSSSYKSQHCNNIAWSATLMPIYGRKI